MESQGGITVNANTGGEGQGEGTKTKREKSRKADNYAYFRRKKGAFSP